MNKQTLDERFEDYNEPGSLTSLFTTDLKHSA